MEWLTIVVTWVSANIDSLIQIVGAFAVVATLTPNTADNAIVDWLLKAINFLGANLGKAKNEDV